MKRRLMCWLAAALLAGPIGAHASTLDLGTAADFGILVLNNGSLTINSTNTFVGNIGVSSGATASIQKIGQEGNGGSQDQWTGALLSYSSNLGYTPKNTDPSGGFYAPGALTSTPETAPGYMGSTYNGQNVQTYLNQANADAQALNTFLGTQAFSNQAIAGNTTINGSGGINYLNITSLINYNSNVLTLNGGANDWFVFKYSGATFDWSQSQVALNGIDASRILWWFSGATDIVINKDSTVWNGTILAPNLTTALTYHNPATFNGSIIANMIDVHSDFNLNRVGFDEPPSTVPEPGTLALLAFGLAGLRISSRRRA